MSETSKTELIAEAEARVNANRFGLSWAREADKDLIVIQRLTTALESLTATLTETEADLQASRAREKALQATVSEIIEAIPLLISEATKADTTVTDEMVDRAASELDQNFNPDRCPVMAAMFRDYARTAIEAALHPTSTEGESR